MKTIAKKQDVPLRARAVPGSAFHYSAGMLSTASALLWCALAAAEPCRPLQQEVSPPGEEDELQSDLKQMQGTWRVVHSQDGDEIAAADEVARRRVTISGNKLLYEYGNPQKESREGTIKLDPETKHFDWMWEIPPEAATMLAIYEIKGDELKIGFGNDGQIRPKRWEIDKDNVVWLLVLKREKPAAAKENDEATWIRDAGEAEIPAHRAAGRIHGKDFTVDTARIVPWHEWSGNKGDPPEKQNRADGAVLTLQRGDDSPPRDYFTIFLAVKQGESVQGKTFVVPLGGLFKQTDKIMAKDEKSWFYPVGGIQINSAEPKKADLFPKATMRLELGKRAGARLPGKIYLCVDDAEKTFVTGTFEAIVEETNGEKLTDARISKSCGRGR